MTRREELEHRAATHCRECLASFETAEKKLHHCHGTGQYLGALCHSCNIAAQTPKTIPVVFHNGGGYDFHFLLRYIATMGSPVSRAPREELGEDSDDEGTESEAEGSGSEPERPMPMAKAAPKAAPKPKAKAAPRPLSGWCALQAASKQGDYSHLCLRVLCKSGEKCLQMSWGPLRFVDSMNVFPTSLASMIDDLRACTHKQLPERFPLMASLHAELQLRTPTDSPPQRRPLKQRLRPGAGVGLHPAQAAHALRALLRRRGVGDARGVGAALLRQRAGGEGGERRGPPAGRQHRQRHGVGDLPRVPRLLPPHRRPGPGGRDGELPGLLPGAVGARPHPLRHAARGRLGRHAAALGPRDAHSPHHRRAGLQGRAGLRHGRAELHLPALRSSQQPRAGRGGLQPRGARQLFNAMYPAAMTLPMPNGPCVAVALPEDNAARLSWLHETCLSSLNWESDAEEVSYLLLVDYDHLDWAPPARKVGKGLYGPHTADMAERLGLSPSPCEKLVPFLGMHVEEGVDGKRLKFLRDVLGARVWRLHRAYRFRCSPFMAGFMELKHSERSSPRTPSSAAAA